MSAQATEPIGIIAGTALRELPGLKIDRQGPNEDGVYLIEGTLNNVPVVMVMRHGFDHNDPPHRVKYKQNLGALKRRGVKRVIAASAMGGITPPFTKGTLAFLDVMTDMTTGRDHTLFHSIAAHVPRDTAVCPCLHKAAREVATKLGLPHQPSGNLVVINGPRFASRQEVAIYRGQGHHLIGMTGEPEEGLAHEYGFHIVYVGQLTDHDHPGEERRPVTQLEITEGMRIVGGMAQSLIGELVQHPMFHKPLACSCESTLLGAILTRRSRIEGTAAGTELCRYFGIKSIPAEWFAHP